MKKWEIVALIVGQRLFKKGNDVPVIGPTFDEWHSEAQRSAGVVFTGTMPRKWAEAARLADVLAGRPAMMRDKPDFGLWLADQPEVTVVEASAATLTQPDGCPVNVSWA